jgi:phage recombination protein Bet
MTAEVSIEESAIARPTVRTGSASTELSLVERVSGLSKDHVEVLRQTICKDLSDPELMLFLTRCKMKGVDPFTQAYAFKGADGRLVTELRIDGMRALARTGGAFKGRTVELMYHPERKEEVVGARCTVWRNDMETPFVEEVLLKEYQTNRGTWDPWQKMPETMIRKVAESHALRAAFPEELAGWYVDEEMNQAEG